MLTDLALLGLKKNMNFVTISQSLKKSFLFQDYIKEEVFCGFFTHAIENLQNHPLYNQKVRYYEK